MAKLSRCPPLIIVNPASSAGRTLRKWRRVEAQVRAALGEVDVHMTDGPGDATYRVRAALMDEPRLVISVGGDGTHHEVVNGFFRPNSFQPVCPEACFSFISSGTGSDLARSFADQRQLPRLLGRMAAFDLMDVDLVGCTYDVGDNRTQREVCVNIASAGLGGWVTRAVDSRAKGWLPARALFFVTSVEGLFRTKPFGAELRVDDGPWLPHRVRNVVVANNRFQGGGMEIAPEASPTDGHLDLVVSGPFPALRLVWASRLIYAGKGHHHPLITMQRASSVEIRHPEGHQPLFLELDGEGLGQTPVRFEVLPKVMRAVL